MKKKKIINFSMIGMSMIFLFNPNVNIIDVLPDFIGYILLCIAITNFADINDTMSEALQMFKKLIIIDAAKIVAILWVFGLSVISERNSSLMLWSFAFGVLEIVFAAPAFAKLFAGITSLGYLHDNTSVLGTGHHGNKSRTDKIRQFTVIFIVLKATMSFLPELSDLTSTEYYENAGLFSLYRYIGIMRLLAFLPVLVVGVIWLINVLAYFKRVDNDKPFVEAIEEIYRERVGDKKGIFIKRNVSICFWLLIIAVFFSFDFRLENINMLPDFISAVLFICFFAFGAKKLKISYKIPILLSCAYFVASLSAYISEFLFYKEYFYSDIDRSMQAREAFILMSSTACASTLLFTSLCLISLFAVKKIIKEHTGVVSISGKETAAQLKITQETHKELNKYIVICISVLAFYALTDISHIFLEDILASVSNLTVGIEALYGELLGYILKFLVYAVNTLAPIGFIGSVFKLYFEVNEAVYSKYILE